nr:MAG TPA: hypothetical protein [Caudoviricetes sp.]
MIQITQYAKRILGIFFVKFKPLYNTIWKGVL